MTTQTAEGGTGTGAAEGEPKVDAGTEQKDDTGRAGGEAALKADLAAERKARQEAQAEVQRFMDQFKSLFGGKQGDPAPTPEALAEQLAALQAQQSEKEKAAEARIKRAEVRSAASRLQFHDAADALSQINLDEIEVVDGDVNVEQIEAALKALAEKKPYLVKQASASAADVGLGGGTGNKSEPKTPQDRIAAGLAAADARRKK